MKHEGMTLVGITGGIGAGKSVVSRVLRLRGFSVYDCDSRAQLLMREPDLRDALCELAGHDVYDASGTLDRRCLASRVFADERLRSEVNRLVHERVRRDINSVRSAMCAAGQCCLFVESAILATSELDKEMDLIWLVDAPAELRVRRVMRRDAALARGQVLARMEAQRAETDCLPAAKLRRIDNAPTESIVGRIDELLQEINNYK